MPEVRFGRRPAAAVTLLALTACGPLLDLVAGTALMDTPVTVLVAVAAGFAAGAWLRPVLAALGSAVDACLLTLASQVADPGAYPVADDLFFFTLLVGAPALGGALVTARRDQVRELRRLSAVRAEQRAAQVRAARLEERNRLEAGVVQGLVQRMGALVVQASGAAREPSADETPAALDRMEESARGALDGDARGAGGASQPGGRRVRGGSGPPRGRGLRPEGEHESGPSPGLTSWWVLWRPWRSRPWSVPQPADRHGPTCWSAWRSEPRWRCAAGGRSARLRPCASSAH